MEQPTPAQLETRASEELLTPDFLRKIEQLSIVAKRVFPGRLRGERRSTKRGAAVEFADYRNYATGDDLRRVDWNVYARLERLFLKLFVEEEDLPFYVLIDSSRSMGFGHPSKLLYAKRIAAALSYIALCGFDQVGLAELKGASSNVLRPRRGKQAAFSVFDYLKSMNAEGDTNLESSIRDFSLRTSRPGLALVISDFFDESCQAGISSLLSRKFEVVLMQVLDQEEVEPSMVGDLLLLDSEDAQRREITITQSLLRSYKRRLQDFRAELEGFCGRYGCACVSVTNQTDFEDLILGYLRRRGMLK